MAQELIHDDCLTWLRNRPTGSIHCCVTDPPYGLKFMGKKWDYDVPAVEIWAEVLRVLKPGGTLLSFAGSRTQHRMAVNIEDAGFMLKDVLLWLNGQGFPKATDIGKQLDKQLRVKFDKRTEDGIVLPIIDAVKQWDGWKSHALKPAYEPIIMAMKPNDGSYANNALTHGVAGLNIEACRVPGESVTINTFDNGAKPFGDAVGEPYTSRQSSGRYPANILHDGSDEVLAGFPNLGKAGKAIRHRGVKSEGVTGWGKRPVGTPDMGYGDDGSAARFFYVAKANKKERNNGAENLITWENVDLDSDLKDINELARAISASGVLPTDEPSCNIDWSGKQPMDLCPTDMTSIIAMTSKTITALTTSNSSQNWSTKDIIRGVIATIWASGSSPVELAMSIKKSTLTSTNDPTASPQNAVHALLLVLSVVSEKGKRGNVHNTVKPLALMRWLVRLVCPAGGVVLDPFMGSGTTGVACREEGFDFIGIELELDSYQTAVRRCKI